MSDALALVPLRTTPAWRWPLLAFVVFVLLVLLGFKDTGTAMVTIWHRSETYAHAFVVPPIVAWLVWRMRHHLSVLTPHPAPSAILLLLFLGGFWWLGSLASVNAAMHFALVGMVAAGVPVFLGWAVARALLFPLAFLFFAVPFGEFMTPTLMQYTADFTVAALRASGIPVYREGLQFVIPSGHWSVVEACSGIRYLMASFMVGSLFAYLNYQSTQRRMAFVALSIIVPIIANWLRAYMIVMLGHLSGNTIATGVDHLVYGWVFFGIVITALFFVGARWAQPESALPTATVSAGKSAGTPSLERWWLATALGLSLAAVLWPLAIQHPPGAVAPTPMLQLPDQLSGNWRGQQVEISAWQPRFIAPAAELRRNYADGSGAVGVHLSYYQRLTESSKLIGSDNVLVSSGDPGWHVVAEQAIQAVHAGKAITLQASTLHSTESAQLAVRPNLRVWRVYWVNGSLTASDVQGKLLQAWAKVKGAPDDAAAIFLFTAQPRSSEEADKLLAAFVNANLDLLVKGLAQTRDKP